MKKSIELAITLHGQNVLAIFPNATEQDPIQLCKKLRRLEVKGNQAACDLCNIPDYQDKADKIFAEVEGKLRTLLGNSPAPIIINRDPRGYCLKIESEYVQAHDINIHRDMGGYGIIAPEIS